MSMFWLPVSWSVRQPAPNDPAIVTPIAAVCEWWTDDKRHSSWIQQQSQCRSSIDGCVALTSVRRHKSPFQKKALVLTTISSFKNKLLAWLSGVFGLLSYDTLFECYLGCCCFWKFLSCSYFQCIFGSKKLLASIPLINWLLAHFQLVLLCATSVACEIHYSIVR